MDQNQNQNKKELLFDGYYYDVTEFSKIHPGGSIIKFYTELGEDGTLPIQQFHKRSEKKVMAIMKSLKRREANIVESDVNFPKNEETLIRHEILTRDFVKLYRELETEGKFEPCYPHIIWRITEAILFASIGTYFSTFVPGILPKLFGYLCICSFIGRSGWLMHEGGHYSLTGKPKYDRIISTIFYGLGFGLSSYWWRRNHNMHHTMTNRYGKDVDIDTYPLFVFNKVCIKHDDIKKAGFFVRNQTYLFLLVSNFLGFMALKFVINPPYILKKMKWLDILMMTTHYVWMLSLGYGIIGYIGVFWVVSNYYYLNFSLSHTHLPMTDQDQMHWVEYAFETTMDIKPSYMVNWWMGYLNFQIEHHLFPQLPQFRHTQINDRVRELALRHNLPYHSEGYFKACKLTFENMKKVSEDIIASKKLD